MVPKAQENIALLQQTVRLLGAVDDQTYRHNNEPLMMDSVGAHVRHNIDHYLCFFAGLETGTVDYDTRRREPVLEVDRSAALKAIQWVCRNLVKLSARPASLRIRFHTDLGVQHGTSSVERELDYLASHTTHHHAIIAVLCRLQNVPVDDDFGVAPATLRYRQSSPIHRAETTQLPPHTSEEAALDAGSLSAD